MRNSLCIAAIGFALVATNAHAGSMSAKKRAQLEAEIRGNAEVQKDLEARRMHLDRAARAGKGIDKVIDYATKRTGTNPVYKGGKKVGNIAVDAYKKRKNK